MAEDKKLEVIYLKLGEKASSFVDSQNKIVLSNNQVVKVLKSELSPGVLSRITSGHLEKTTREEYEAFLQGKEIFSTSQKLPQDSSSVNTESVPPNSTQDEQLKKAEAEFYGDKTKSDLIDLIEELAEENPNLDVTNLKKLSLKELIELHKKHKTDGTS